MGAETSDTSCLRGRYTLHFLARGGMGTLHEALDGSTGRRVVVKQASTADPVALASIVAERETLVRLDHPGIVKALDFFIEGSEQYLVLEKVEGRSLADLLASSSNFIDEKALADWALQLADVLSYLHGQSPPVIHRDLKPEHCILREDGRIVLIDFGIARLKKGSTRDTQALGTPGYAPPEQYGLPDGGETDERSDIYALGATLFHLATGKDPASFTGQLPDPAHLRPGLSAPLGRLIRKATAREASARYRDTKELMGELSAPRGGGSLVESLAEGLEACLAGALLFVAWRLAVVPLGRLSGQEAWALPLAALLALLLGFASAAILGAVRWRISPAAAAGRALRLAGARMSPRREVPPLRAGLLLAGLSYLASLLLLTPLVTLTGALELHLRRLMEQIVTPPYTLMPPPAWLWALPGALAGLIIFTFFDALARRRGGLAALAVVVLLCGAGAAAWGSHLRALDHRTRYDLLIESAPVWSVDYPAEADCVMAHDPEHGTISHLVLSFKDGAIRSLDPATGALRWSLAGRAARVVHQTHDIADFESSRGFSRLDITTGRLLWTAPVRGEVRYVGAGAGTMVLQSAEGDLLLVGERDGRLIGRLPHPSVFLLEAGHATVYVGSAETGILRAVSLLDGAERWTAPLGAREPGVLGADLSSVSWTNGTRVLVFDRTTGLPVASGGPVPAALEASLPRRLVGTHLRELQVSAEGGYLRFYDTRTMRQTRRIDLFPDEVTRAQSDGDVLLAATNHGRILALTVPEGRLLWERWDLPESLYLLPVLAPPIPFLWAERRAVMYPSESRGAFVALDRETGDEFWSYPLRRGEQVRLVMWDGENMFLVLNTPKAGAPGASRITHLRLSRRYPDRG